MTKLSILHFNDVYRVRPQKISPSGNETVDVAQFCQLVDDAREHWLPRTDGKRDGLVLFSGDVFSPSVESSVTRGRHMVPVMNEIGPDVALTGNHDFDFGYPHLCKLIQQTKFPWLLSNIIDAETSRVPENLCEFIVIERSGLRIGIIGLVEREWIGTVSSWPQTFMFHDMAEAGMSLSRRLRDPKGEYKCDFIIALTHSRYDIVLAHDLLAASPSAQRKNPIHDSHGVDIILGGHDHLYYVSRGVDSWEGYDLQQNVLGAEEDHGDVLVVKSGTDFRDLSELELELVDTPEGSVRRKVVKKIEGRRHAPQPNSKPCGRLTEILASELSRVSDSLKSPVCRATAPIDTRSHLIRVAESAAGNWFADIVRHAYDDALCLNGHDGVDGAFICAGMLRGDSIYGPGTITLGDILEILPFEDPLVVLELDGETIWTALEVSLETWPAQEGRFPVISGFRVAWDSRRPARQRVVGVWLLREESLSAEEHQRYSRGEIIRRSLKEESIQRQQGGRQYKILTREYMAQGHDGFLPLKGRKYLIDDESGQMMSAIVRKYLLGSQFVNKMVRQDASNVLHLHPETENILHREKTRNKARSRAAHNWQYLANVAVHRSRSREHYQSQISVASREHMSEVDCFHNEALRNYEELSDSSKNDLLVIHPEVDGRLQDLGRS
ncbi:Metallo-dependent phosphatase [Neolentinus lepideus HHB14362 ss-1]|uniref:Metallo-dependent phosphatase n=1 Tax=Neolentinus lepideus HHB14362 ss-1 TaxID=1314782 RepID=A0A165T9C6_9AGAM|nr:Metallo-dependent phosphatase [Neolentinus lepideus HHB14362 ss-1]